MNNLTTKILTVIKNNPELKEMYLSELDVAHDCKLMDPDKNFCECTDIIKLLNN